MSEMLVAVRSGYVEDWDGEIVWIEAGKYRVAPEVIQRQPAWGDYFSRDVTARGSDSERSVFRNSMTFSLRYPEEP